MSGLLDQAPQKDIADLPPLQGVGPHVRAGAGEEIR